MNLKRNKLTIINLFNFTHMRYFKTLFIIAMMMLLGQTSEAQRYLKPVFNEVEVSPIIPYGENYTVLFTLLQQKNTSKQLLPMQIYSPKGDTETKRPLIIYLHTGNFFPFPINGSCGGALNDSSNVEFATRLAKMGYVVAVASYRQGWAPTATTETTRRFTLINGAYRGLQDVSTCIRYFRKNVDVGGNTFKIDPNKIVVWGQGTGGYLSLASAYLNKFQDIYTTSDPNKFVIINPALPGGKYNMVQEATNGDLYATTGPTRVDALLNAVSGGLFKVGDTLCIPNHVGYPSNFNLCVNMGGAIGDSTWLDKGDIPLISYHVRSDPFAPCETNILNVPTAGGPQPVVEVTGSCGLQTYVEKYGNNDIFKKILPAADPMGVIAKEKNGGANGFFPFVGTPNNTSAPWEWTNYNGNPKPTATDCNTSPSVARTYIDTIIAYFAPRGCIALGLNCAGVSSAPELLTNDYVQMSIAPNPATDMAFISVREDLSIQHIEVYDISGRMVHSARNINQHNYQFERNGLPKGMFIAKAYFKEGVIAQKFLFD